MFMRKILAAGILMLVVAGIVFALPPQANSANDKGPLEKITFIHYKKSFAKPPWAGGGGGSTKSNCYTFLASGAKWKKAEPYYVNPSNSQGIAQSLIVNSTTAGVSAWDSEVTAVIFGAGSVDSNASYN